MPFWESGFFPAVRLVEEHGALHGRLKTYREANAFIRTHLKDLPAAGKVIEAVTAAAKSGSDKDKKNARSAVLTLLVKHGLAVKD